MAKNFGRIAAGTAIAGGAFLIKWLASREKAVSPMASADPIEETAAVERTLEEDPGMATLGEVEQAIFEVEKVKVSFRHPSGRDARSNKRGFTPYSYQKKLNSDYTVANFIKQRIAPLYEHHGLRIVVTFQDRSIAHGGNMLRQVRESFET
jgi:hypothetical protein